MHINRLLLVAGAVALVLAGSQARAACKVSMGWEDFPPFQMKVGDRVTGIDVDLFQAAAEIAGCTVTLKELPWTRLLKLLENGRMGAAAGASITPEREAYARFTASFRAEELVLFLRAGDLGRYGSGGIEAFLESGGRLGTVSSYEYGDAFAVLRKDPRFARQIFDSRTSLLSLRKLLQNRVDGFIENRFVGVAIARGEGVIDKIEGDPILVSANPSHLMFSKKAVDKATVDAFDRALAAMKADGRYDTVVAKYLK